jgi:osmotically-inducible protein OsmY
MPFSRAWLAVLLAGAALTLAACDNAGNRTAGEKLDSAIAKTEQAADTAAAKTAEALKEAKAKIDASGTAAEVKDAAKNAGAAVSATVDDAAITASVSAGLAKDPDLSAIKIDVDTKGGVVSLKGPAPTAAARARAEEIAKGVQGVTSVNNQLEVRS